MKVSPTTMFRSTAFVFGSRAVDAVVAIIFSIFVARMLGESRYGFVGATMGVVGLVSIIGNMGLSNATTKWISEYDAVGATSRQRTIIAAAVIIEFALGMAGAVICFAFADRIAVDVFGKPEIALPLKVAAPIVLLGPFTNGIIAVFQGYHRMEYFMLTTTAGGVARMVSTLVFLTWDNSIPSAVMGFLVGHLCATVFSSAILVVKIIPNIGPEPFAPMKDEVTRIFTFGLPILFMEAASMIYEWTGTLFLAALSDDVRDVSWFTIAFGIVSLPLLLSRSVGTAIFPIISNLHARKKRRTLRAAYAQAMKLTLVTMLPITLLLLALGPYVIYVLYGEGFLPAMIPLMALTGWALLRPLATVSGASIAGVTHPEHNAYAAIITLSINIPMLFLFIPVTKPWPFSFIPVSGVVGAALATTLSYIVGMSLQIYWANKYIRARLDYRRFMLAIAAGMAAATVSGLIVLAAGNPIDLGTWKALAVGAGAGLAGLGTYLVMIRFLGVMDKADMEMVRQLNVPAKRYILKLVRFLTKDGDAR